MTFSTAASPESRSWGTQKQVGGITVLLILSGKLAVLQAGGWSRESPAQTPFLMAREELASCKEGRKVLRKRGRILLCPQNRREQGRGWDWITVWGCGTSLHAACCPTVSDRGLGLPFSTDIQSLPKLSEVRMDGLKGSSTLLLRKAP